MDSALSMDEVERLQAGARGVDTAGLSGDLELLQQALNRVVASGAATDEAVGDLVRAAAVLLQSAASTPAPSAADRDEGASLLRIRAAAEVPA